MSRLLTILALLAVSASPVPAAQERDRDGPAIDPSPAGVDEDFWYEASNFRGWKIGSLSLTGLDKKRSRELRRGLELEEEGAVLYERSLRRDIPAQNDRAGRRGSFLAGVALSGGNPYFLVWWATLGTALVMQSREFGLKGFVIFGLVHWACDLAWLWLLSALAFRGRKVFGGLLQKAVFVVCAVFLFGIGWAFIWDAVVSLGRDSIP